MRRLFCVLLLLGLICTPVWAQEEVPIHRNGVGTGKVALSFDDGPHPTYTAEILEILKENGVKSTFFVVGQNAREHPDLVRRIAEEGHEIGNHTDSHAFLRDLSLAAMCKEVTEASDTIEEITGRRPVLFRPPGGSYSDSKIRVLSEMGYVSVLWSKDTRDWTRPSVQSIVDAADIHVAHVLITGVMGNAAGFGKAGLGEHTLIISRGQKLCFLGAQHGGEQQIICVFYS